MPDVDSIRMRHAKLTAERNRLQLVATDLRSRTALADTEINRVSGAIAECEFWITEHEGSEENSYPTLKPMEKT